MSNFFKQKNVVPSHLNKYFMNYEEYEEVINDLQIGIIFESIDWGSLNIDISNEFYYEVAMIKYRSFIDVFLQKFMVCNDIQHTLNYINTSHSFLVRPKIYRKVGDVDVFEKLEKIKQRFINF
jgi:hypothetical protein